MLDGTASDDIDEECKGIGCRDAARGRVSEVWTRWTRGLPVNDENKSGSPRFGSHQPCIGDGWLGYGMRMRTRGVRCCRAAPRNGAGVGKVGADVRQGVVVQNTRPNRISVGGVWNGRSGDPVSRSGVHCLIWTLPPAHFYPRSNDFPFPLLF